MDEDRIKKLKENCLQLFQLKDDSWKYETETDKIGDKVHSLKLEHLIDPEWLELFLLRPVEGKDVSKLSQSEFEAALDEYFIVNNVDYYFQITELEDFPDNYRLGHGTLFTFASLPQQVRDVAISLSKHDAEDMPLSTQNFFREKGAFEQLLIPTDPNLGHWLKIPCRSIGLGGLDRASEYAEESLDILRIAVFSARVHLPRYAIALDTNKNTAFLTARTESHKCPYDWNHQRTIDRLNTLYDTNDELSSDIEKRIRDAGHFLRIGDNNSPDYQRIFFYAAAIEHLILGSDDEKVLRWKFSEKGAILLSNNLEKRLDQSQKLKNIYDARCDIAHGEKSDYDFELTTSCRYYLKTILIKMLYLIDTHGLRTIVKKGEQNGESLDEYLNNIIYSGKYEKLE